jgi:pyridinium-3,5-bisthiocarboxylic acid mononucleotide nickel chelatase
MRHIHLDAVGGIAGDMFAAALLDAMPELRERVFSDLEAVRPSGRRLPALHAGMSGGVRALRFALDRPDTASGHRGHHHHHHDHGHHHHHVDEEHHHHEHEGEHGSSYRELADLLAAAPLADGTANEAQGILLKLAQAESRVHDVPVDAVHFHEVGDWDSLMDVVAAGSILAALDGVSWSVSPLPVGHGFVKTQHGILPVPAPATTELLRGFTWRDDGVQGERVTPTGAAILAYLNPLSRFEKHMNLLGSGTGAGTREFAQFPNVLRALILESQPEIETSFEHASIRIVSFDIDDMTGEEIGVAVERLRAVEGVLDVSIGTRQGKKHRPVTEFQLMIDSEDIRKAARACFLETSTLGLRWREESRLCLRRESKQVEVDGTRLRGKMAFRPDQTTTLKIESDDVAHYDGLSARRKIKHGGEKH